MYIRSVPHSEKPEVSVLKVAETSITDGPGKRLVVFFQGCGISCEWCHSPHLQPAVCPLIFNESLCMACLRCKQVCKHGVHRFVGGVHKLNRSLCVQCGACIEACPRSAEERSGGALYIPGVRLSANALYKQIKPYLELCGRITFSGGEALLQTDGVLALLKLCKGSGVDTAIETSGLLNMDMYRRALPYVDTWLVGIRLKTGINAPLRTGEANAALDLLTSQKNTRIIPRIPLVPGVTESVITDTADILKKRGITHVWLNPWNTDYDLYYKSAGFSIAFVPPSQKEIARCTETVKQFLTKNGFEIFGS